MNMEGHYTTEFPRKDARLGKLLLACVDNDNGKGHCKLCRGWAHMGYPIHHAKMCPLPAACRALGYELPNVDKNGKVTFKPQPAVRKRRVAA